MLFLHHQPSQTLGQRVTLFKLGVHNARSLCQKDNFSIGLNIIPAAVVASLVKSAKEVGDLSPVDEKSS
jgi:hypothetical protein